MKKEILDKIRSAKKSLDDTVYLHMMRLGYNTNCSYFEVLEFMRWFENKYPGIYEDFGLNACYESLVSFGCAYDKIFRPYPIMLTLDSEGIYSSHIGVDKMFHDFYEYVVLLEDDRAALEPIQASFDMEVMVEMVNQIKQLHAVQFTGRTIANTDGLTDAEKRKQKKEEKDRKVQQMRNRAHNKILIK